MIWEGPKLQECEGPKVGVLRQGVTIYRKVLRLGSGRCVK